MDIDEEDEDDEMDDEEAEEEHSAPAYPVVVALPATAPSAEETEHLLLAYISPPDHHFSMVFITTPDSCPLSPPFTVLPAPPLSPISYHGISSATIRMRAEVRYEVRRELRRALMHRSWWFWADSGFVATMGAPVSTDTELGAHMREFELLVRRDTDEIYTERVMETEAGMSRRGVGTAMDASDLVHGRGYISTHHSAMRRWQRSPELQSAGTERQRACQICWRQTGRRRGRVRGVKSADRPAAADYSDLTAVQTLQRETIPLPGTRQRDPWGPAYGAAEAAE
ncbi:hypothetical protein Tco_0549425 [Tanacetum coccineum]